MHPCDGPSRTRLALNLHPPGATSSQDVIKHQSIQFNARSAIKEPHHPARECSAGGVSNNLTRFAPVSFQPPPLISATNACPLCFSGLKCFIYQSLCLVRSMCVQEQVETATARTTAFILCLRSPLPGLILAHSSAKIFPIGSSSGFFFPSHIAPPRLWNGARKSGCAPRRFSILPSSSSTKRSLILMGLTRIP